MRVLGLDQATRKTGFCLLVEQQIEDYGEVTTPRKLKGAAGLYHMAAELRYLWQRLEVDAIGIEGVHAASGRSGALSDGTGELSPRNVATIGLLYGLYYTLGYAAQQDRLRTYTVHSAQMGQHLGLGIRSRRQERKESSIAQANFILSGSQIESDHIADAIHIALIAEANIRLEDLTP